MPYFHVLPPSVDVLQPTSPLPHPIDPGTRATWKVPTMVLPHEKKSGSTSVLCTLSELCSVSVLSFTSVYGVCAAAIGAADIAKARTTVKRENEFLFIRFSFWVRQNNTTDEDTGMLVVMRYKYHFCFAGRTCFA